jgi:hypothetical protein
LHPEGFAAMATRTANKGARISAAALLACAAIACGNGGQVPSSLTISQQELNTDNGLTIDVLGLVQDALLVPVDGESDNGMPPNYLALNGLSPGALATPEFERWFASDPMAAHVLMRYLTRCALPAWASLSYEYGGLIFSWQGSLSMAPLWASGEPIPEVEQQLVSGCLAAHANKYGVKVPISVYGRYSSGEALPIGDGELDTYSVTEGCFFGNVFQMQGTFSGNDRPMSLTDAESSIRACAMGDRTGTASSYCPPLVYAGNCSDVCVRDATGVFYESCTVNGVSFRPITTRIKPSSQFTCGDGICQQTESCGEGTTWDSCSLDCGLCN